MERHDAAEGVPFGEPDYELRHRDVLYDGFFRMERWHVRHRLFQGGWTGVFTREVFVRHEAVVVLLVDVDRERIVMIEQFRAPAIGRGPSPWVLELVAGLIDKDEEPGDVARREAVEEAGCTIQSLHLIAEYLPSPGGSDEYVYLYAGLVDSEGVGGVHGLPDEHEDIRVHLVPFDDVRGMIGQGRINNAATLIALQWLLLNRDRLAGLLALPA